MSINLIESNGGVIDYVEISNILPMLLKLKLAHDIPIEAHAADLRIVLVRVRPGPGQIPIELINISRYQPGVIQADIKYPEDSQVSMRVKIKDDNSLNHLMSMITFRLNLMEGDIL